MISLNVSLPYIYISLYIASKRISRIGSPCGVNAELWPWSNCVQTQVDLVFELAY